MSEETKGVEEKPTSILQAHIQEQLVDTDGGGEQPEDKSVRVVRQGEDQKPEQEDQTSESVQKRIDALTGEKGHWKRVAEKARLEAEDMRARVAALEARVSEPPPAPPGEDADPKEIHEYYQTQMKKTNEANDEALNARLANIRMQSMIDSNPDFMELHDKYWSIFNKDPEMGAILRASDDPIGEFYRRAKAVQEKDTATTVIEDLETQIGAAQASAPQAPTPPEPQRKPTDNEGVSISDAEYRWYCQKFPGLNKTKAQVEADLTAQQQRKEKFSWM